jgi:hydrogenase assembly chaperone HypC/HupF
MCIATPVRVLKLKQTKATVEALGKKSQVDVSLLKNVKLGDYLYASNGLAIKKVSRGDAEKVLELVRSWNE